MLLHENILAKVSPRKNALRKTKECEIILASYGVVQSQSILESTLAAYRASGSVNVNLALNLIKTKLLNAEGSRA